MWAAAATAVVAFDPGIGYNRSVQLIGIKWTRGRFHDAKRFWSPKVAAQPRSSTSRLLALCSKSRKFANVARVYGAHHGVRGIVNEDLLDLTQETTHNLEMVAATPSSALGSTRDKPDAKYCQEIFEVLRAHEIGAFFYIGGNDSSDTVRIVSEEAQKANYPLRAIHIPKTIDNDLVGNDHTPGFPSAARFVAQAFAGANLDNAALPGVYIGVVMGRHAGFLTAASALGRKLPDDGPHLIYVPERTFDVEKFLGT